MSRETTLPEVLSALEDVELTTRFADYRIDPTNSLVPLRRERVLREGYAYRFEQPYLDPDAFPNNPVPDFMATALLRLGATVYDWCVIARPDNKMPHIQCHDLMLERVQQLRAEGYDVWFSDWMEDFESRALVVKLKNALFFIPLDVCELWMENLATTMAEVALIDSM